MPISNHATKSQNSVVLVANGAGYVGSQISKGFRSHGYVPVTVGNLSTGNV